MPVHLRMLGHLSMFGHPRKSDSHASQIDPQDSFDAAIQFRYGEAVPIPRARFDTVNGQTVAIPSDQSWSAFVTIAGMLP
ncbi:hypothetical protein SAMN06265222_11013 [Neorhodopirellula lusitana]|uniref:Uncharacterized protein n=1 Tax=Neorhodopirellula lusitana TaxID=445327 RepID=A0ABY1QEY2_9BACT|nr:hypothetical protein SAMN06265222_11013 [Neorhodopirellula lusitana]